MKLDFLPIGGAQASVPLRRCSVESEVHRLTDVLLCQPAFLKPVPCCSVTRETLERGLDVSVPTALSQHRALQAALEKLGVRCHFLAPEEGLPDMCFTRDALVTTPWGLLALNPAAGHRKEEAAIALHAMRKLGAPLAARVRNGTAEGGDIAIIRRGLVIVGCSGERTCEAGADAVADIFGGQGWDVLIYRFDPRHLHLDTQFAMVGEGLALGCTEILTEDFLMALDRYGIEVIPVSYEESRALGCNILALGDRRVLASADNERVNALMRARGFDVATVEIDQFTRCGGGVHCLTMPLARIPNRAEGG